MRANTIVAARDGRSGFSFLARKIVEMIAAGSRRLTAEAGFRVHPDAIGSGPIANIAATTVGSIFDTVADGDVICTTAWR